MIKQIDRSRADGAAARQRHLGLAHARKQRRNDPEAGPHFRNEFIGRGRVDDRGRGNLHGLAGMLDVAGALARQHDVDAMVVQDALELHHVGEMGNVFQDQHVFGEKTGDHQRQGRVLGTGNRDRALQRPSAGNPNAIHAPLHLTWTGCGTAAILS